MANNSLFLHNEFVLICFQIAKNIYSAFTAIPMISLKVRTVARTKRGEAATTGTLASTQDSSKQKVSHTQLSLSDAWINLAYAENTNLRGSIIVWLTSCLFCLDSAAFYVELTTALLDWSNANKSNWRSAIQ